IVRYHNEGAAFSFLAGAGGWQRFFFSAVAILASVVILFLLRKHKTERLFCFALALVLGGALGNLYDRLTLGYVVDFLFFYYQSWNGADFHVSDSAITYAVVLLVIESYKVAEKKTISGQYHNTDATDLCEE